MIKTIMANWTIQAINFVTSLMAARILGPDTRGQLAIVLLYPQLISNLGLLGLDRGMSISTGKGLIKHNIWPILSLSLVLSLLTFAIFYPVAHEQVRDTNIFTLSLIYSAYIPFFFVFMLILASFQGDGAFAKYNTARIAYYVAYLGLLVAFWALGYTELSTFVIANLSAMVIAACYSLRLYYKQYGIKSFNFKQPFSDISVLFKNSWIFIAPMLIIVFASQIDLLIINMNMNEKILGFYVVYLAFSRLTGSISNAFNVHMFHESIQDTTNNMPLKMVRVGIIYLIITLTLMFIASPAIKILYGMPYIAELRSLYLIIAASFFYFLSQVLMEFFRGKQNVQSDMAGSIIYICILSAPYIISNPPSSLEAFAFFLICAELARFLFYGSVFIKHETSLL